MRWINAPAGAPRVRSGMDATVAAPSAPARALRGAFDAIEIAFGRAFPAAIHPWRQLGALAYLTFWIVAATGIYLYVGFDTRAISS